MKIKIFNIKMKKGFLRIAASLLACASLMVSVGIPGQAAKEGVWPKFSSANIDTLKRECQQQIEDKIKGCLSADFGPNDSIEIGNYTFTKKRYQHIAYGDYENGVSFSGLHMNCGLKLLEESLRIFKNKIGEALNKNPNLTILSNKEKEALKTNEKLINEKKKQLEKDPDFIKLTDEEKKAKEKKELESDPNIINLTDEEKKALESSSNLTNLTDEEKKAPESNSNLTNLTDEEKKAVKEKAAWIICKEALEKDINAYKDLPNDLPNKDNNSNKLMHLQLIHSNVSHTSRYLFPENWGFTELKKALEIAIGQKAGFEKILTEKSKEITTKKDEIQAELIKLEENNKDIIKSANISVLTNENEETKKDKLNNLLKQYALNDMLYGCEKKQLALKDECFPNLYGYDHKNGNSVSFHIIDIGEVKDNKKNGQEILVQLVTDELSKEIVTFFPISVQKLEEGQCCIVPNEGEDYVDDNSNNSPETDNNSSKTKVYDIFQLDKLDNKQFLKRTEFEISDKFKNNASSLINNRNMNVLRGILNKFENHKKDEQSGKYFKELDDFVNSKLTNYIESAKNETESIKKVDTLDESDAGTSNEKDKKLHKTHLIKKLKYEFEKLGKNTGLPQNSDKTEESYDEKELVETKIFMLTTILGNVSNINTTIKDVSGQLKNKIDIFKNKKDDLGELKSTICNIRKQLAKCVELMQKDNIETLLLKSEYSDKCEFAQGGLDLSEEVKGLNSLDKYVSELDQLLNNLLRDNTIFSRVMEFMKNKLDKEDKIEKDKGKSKEEKKKERDAKKAAKKAAKKPTKIERIEKKAKKAAEEKAKKAAKAAKEEAA